MLLEYQTKSKYYKKYELNIDYLHGKLVRLMERSIAIKEETAKSYIYIKTDKNNDNKNNNKNTDENIYNKKTDNKNNNNKKQIIKIIVIKIMTIKIIIKNR